MPGASPRPTGREHRRARYVELEGVDHAPVAGDTDAIVDDIRALPTGVRERPSPDRVLATALFTDIVGSTERAATLGDREWRALLGILLITYP